MSGARAFLAGAAALLLAAAPRRAAAQDLTGDALVWRTDDTRTGWRIGVGRELTSPLGVRFYGTHVRALDALDQDRYGVGGDLTLFERGRPGPYLLGGLSAGILRRSGETDGWWAWDAGVGYELVPVSWFVLRGEGRWRVERPGPERGLALSLGAVIRLRVSSPPPQRPYTEVHHATPPGEARVADLARDEGISRRDADVVAGVVATATAAMGTPYQWGGNGNGGGFDCSGLIQYAYREHGIALPRVSRDQARVGRAVARRLDALAPGDILTFSNSGGHVTHVALYVGDGKIIHSANGGVQLSLLSPTDPYGKWWWKRWVGARRVVGG